MRFKDFVQLDEVGTSTSCVASFKRISIPLTRRIFPPEIGWTDPEEKQGKKNPYRVPQLKEFFQQQQQLDFSGQDQSSKAMAKQLNDLSGQVGTDPNQRQLVTLMKTMSSTYNRLSDQWVQTNRLVQQSQNPMLQQMLQPKQTGSGVVGAINKVGNAVQNVIGRGGSLSASPMTTGGQAS